MSLDANGRSPMSSGEEASSLQNDRSPNNWGRWGAGDERGTTNFITSEQVLRAASLIRTGRVISCAIDLDARSTPTPPDRQPPAHFYAYSGTDFLAPEHLAPRPEFSGVDDYCFMALQTGTHWDGLAHAHHGGTLYNGFSVATVSAFHGALRCSIDKLRASLVGRGVLLDLPAQLGVSRLPPGHVISPDELDAAARVQGVTIQTGDILLLRTGHLAWFYSLASKNEFWSAASPGIGSAVVAWLHDNQVAALAMDNVGVEVNPPEEEGKPYPLHSRLIRDLGLTIGELWWLEELAEACRSDGRYEFFLSAPPLSFVGAAGSPTNPIVVK